MTTTTTTTGTWTGPSEAHGEARGGMRGRVALVTGGGSGLGRAVCRDLAVAGARVVVADIDASGSDTTAQLVQEAGGEADVVHLDVTDPARVDAVVGELGESHGPAFDCVVSNAGTDRGADLTRIEDDDWHTVFAVNVHGPMYLTRAFLRHVASVGAPPRGPADLVAVVSISALTVGAGAAAYNTSKAAMLKLAEIAQTEVREQALPARVSILNPAAMATPMMDRWGLPAERMMDPEVVAGLVRTAVTLPADAVLQQAVITPRVEWFPR